MRTDALDWVDVEGEIVVLDTEHAVYLTPNPSGAALWRMLAEGATHRQLVAGLVDAFGITRQRAEQDVEAFIARLERHGLLMGPDD